MLQSAADFPDAAPHSDSEALTPRPNEITPPQSDEYEDEDDDDEERAYRDEMLTEDDDDEMFETNELSLANTRIVSNGKCARCCIHKGQLRYIVRQEFEDEIKDNELDGQSASVCVCYVCCGRVIDPCTPCTPHTIYRAEPMSVAQSVPMIGQ